MNHSCAMCMQNFLAHIKQSWDFTSFFRKPWQRSKNLKVICAKPWKIFHLKAPLNLQFKLKFGYETNMRSHMPFRKPWDRSEDLFGQYAGEVMWHMKNWWPNSTLPTRPNASTSVVTSVKVLWLQIFIFIWSAEIEIK